LRTQVTAQAKRCSSPPDKSSMLRLRTPTSSFIKYKESFN
jgi:hypothetical protein